MGILDYLIYVLKCMASLTGIILLFSICLSAIRNERHNKRKQTIEIEKLLRELEESNRKDEK